MADKDKNKRWSLGSGLAEKAAKKLEGRQRDLDRRIKQAVQGKRKDKKSD